MKTKISWIILLPLFANILSINAQDIPPTTSLVYPGIDGRLVYVADSLGNKIPDFSNAGYKGGGVPIPTVAIKATIWPVLGDNAENIQKAIDSVSAMPQDAYGFRGAILIKMGFYRIEKPIYIKASGVVLRGEGMGDTGTILYGILPPPDPNATGRQRFARPAFINIGAENGAEVLENSKQVITDDYVPFGAVSFNVKSAKGLKKGDKVMVRRFGNEDWVKALNMKDEIANSRPWKFDINYDREIININGNTITVDAPIFTAIDVRWGGGELLKYNEKRIENVGIENLRGISDYDPTVRTTTYGNMDRDKLGKENQYQGDEYYSDENHYSNFISFDNIKNAWVRNVSALHFVYSAVIANGGAKWITVQDCQSLEPVSVRAGGRRFTFKMNGQLCLVQRCLSYKGRHSFAGESSTASGNVFLECKAIYPYSTSEPHGYWVNGILYDNVQAPLTARYWDFIMGWAGANTVFWNCEGDFLIQGPPTAQNYSFGHIGVNAVVFNTALMDLTKPNGHVESMDKHVTPKSLYLTQLKERLGMEAVNNILLNAGL
ncbi:hypothetical protein [Confluentibacter sediminis]|uniref:hypothetical protein n=1 Tax=Confluentibacter sediminis TaxID=2219045 RepID=UPI000DAE3B58|nr:hypothetical protein [Confluentibacter sediminis]